MLGHHCSYDHGHNHDLCHILRIFMVDLCILYYFQRVRCTILYTSIPLHEYNVPKGPSHRIDVLCELPSLCESIIHTDMHPSKSSFLARCQHRFCVPMMLPNAVGMYCQFNALARTTSGMLSPHCLMNLTSMSLVSRILASLL